MSELKRRRRRGSGTPAIIFGLVLLLGAVYGGWRYRDALFAGPTAEVEQAAAVPAGAAVDLKGLSEACGVALAGSNTIGEHLAPAVVAAFLRYNQYQVGPPTKIADGEVRIVGVRERWKCTVDVRSHGSGTAFKDLTEGTALIGMSSRPIKAAEVEALKAAGAGDFAGRLDASEHVVALDGIAMIVHPSNPIRQISKSDVKRVFLGGITDWSALGAPFGQIRVHARNDASGTFQFFHETVLDKDKAWDGFAPQARRYESSTELVNAVAADPQAIGFVGLAYVGPGVRALLVSDGGPAFAANDGNVRSEIYPISRRLFLYVRPEVYDDNNFVNALVNHFKSAEAYSIVQDLKYVSLRPVDVAVGGPAEPAGPEIACRENTPEAEVYRASTVGAQRMASVIRFLPGSNSADSLARDDIGRAMPTIKDALAAGAVVRLIGHSDANGSEAVNRRLAMARAEAIRQEFERQGVLGLAIESAGEMCPVAGNDSPAGRESNRRVEIWIARMRA